MADAVAQLTSEYLDLVFDTFPTAATVFGRHEHDGRLEVLTSDRLDDFTRRLKPSCVAGSPRSRRPTRRRRSTATPWPPSPRPCWPRSRSVPGAATCSRAATAVPASILLEGRSPATSRRWSSGWPTRPSGWSRPWRSWTGPGRCWTSRARPCGARWLARLAAGPSSWPHARAPGRRDQAGRPGGGGRGQRRPGPAGLRRLAGRRARRPLPRGRPSPSARPASPQAP